MTLAAAPSVEEVPLDDLRPDPADPRRIGDHEPEALTQRLRRFGVVQPKLRLIGAVPAVSQATALDPDVLKIVLAGWGHDLVGPAAVS